MRNLNHALGAKADRFANYARIAGIFALSAGLSACNGTETAESGATGDIIAEHQDGYGIVPVQNDVAVNAPAPASETDNVTAPAPVPIEPQAPAPTPTVTPAPTPTPTPTGQPLTDLGPSCASDDPDFMCLGLKYIVYVDDAGSAVISESQALANLKQMNEIWARCNIGFQFDQYVELDPTLYELLFNTSSSGELADIRRTFQEDQTLLVVTTGAWSGSLGAGSANAWTQMPGSDLHGAVLESAVGDYPNIIAHELGHYLNLDHAGAASNVMSAVIYTTSMDLTDSQCSAARAAVTDYWQNVAR